MVRGRLRIPATSGNLGPGFDSLGLALGQYDEIEFELLPDAPERIVVNVIGEGAGQVPSDGQNLVARAFRRGLAAFGGDPAGIILTCHNAIPHGRGLGSSAAAVVGGIAIARAGLDDPTWVSDQEILELATEFEGHPDNAAPAIFGGATVAWTRDDGRVAAETLRVSEDLVATVFIPDFELPTARARAVLPSQVPHSDAAFNASRAALLVYTLGNVRIDPELLFDATTDRLHQEYRSGSMPPSWELLNRLRTARFAALISGAGPAVLVLGGHDDQDRLAEFARAELAAGPNWRMHRVPIDREGFAFVGN